MRVPGSPFLRSAPEEFVCKFYLHRKQNLGEVGLLGSCVMRFSRIYCFHLN